MQDIETQAIKTYEKNLAFFSDKHKDVLTKIQALNSAIESGQYKEKYSLEYMKTYFDVKENATQSYLYDADSTEISKQLLKQINFDKNNYSFDGFRMYYNIEKIENQLSDIQKSLLGIYPLMSYYIDATRENNQLKKIDKFIFIGIGLGLHIELIHSRIKAKKYCIIEDDLELFHLSLFCTPYYSLSEETDFMFCIAQTKSNFVNTFEHFLQEEWYANKYLKYSYFPAHSDNKIKLIQNVLASQDFMTFPYRAMVDKHLKPLEFINNDYAIVNLSQHLEGTIFSKKPTLVIGAGPSLDKNTQWLKKNHSKFIIVAVSSTLKHFYSINIKPDIVIHLDGFQYAINLFNSFNAAEFLKDSLLLFGSFAPTNVRKLFKKEQCFFLEENTYYFEGFSSRHGACVGSTSLLHALMFDAQETYILGLDYALDTKTGRSHAEAHVNNKEQSDMSKKTDLQTTMDSQILFAVKGNFEEEVFTNPLFYSSIQALHNLIPHLKKEGQKIYNLNDGALIETAKPIRANEIQTDSFEVLDKEYIHHEIREMLQKNSKSTLSSADVDSLKLRLENVKKIKSFLHNYSKVASYSNADTYLSNLLDLISKIFHLNGSRETDNIVETYFAYFKYTLPIIDDMLNTKGLKNIKRHMKKIDKILLTELQYIEARYEDVYGEFLEKRCN